LSEFQKVLKAAGFNSRKSDGVYKRREITLHSFRRFVKTTIDNQTKNTSYSEWLLGHAKSSYYTNKHDELRRIYKEDCMKYLTFLDYPTLEASARSLEAKLEAKDREIAALNAKIQNMTAEADQNTDQINALTKEMQQVTKFMHNVTSQQKHNTEQAKKYAETIKQLTEIAKLFPSPTGAARKQFDELIKKLSFE
jgi:methyl-accepting chemotaxis protein